MAKNRTKKGTHKKPKVSTPKALTREDFKVQVLGFFDGGCCVPHCDKEAVDAHHILNRNLWVDENQGYYLENGAALCSQHHYDAELGLIRVPELREFNGTKELLPECLTGELVNEQEYDSWGNVLGSSYSKPGPLYFDKSYQKIKAQRRAYGEKLFGGSFIERFKFPRIKHMPESKFLDRSNTSNDDKIMGKNDADYLFAGMGGELVVTEKMDGENITFGHDYIHARSIVSLRRHSSRTYVKALHARLSSDIPTGYRVVGENLQAKKSISYPALKDYFQVFAVFDQRGVLLSWEDTVAFAKSLNLEVVEVLYVGSSEKKACKAWSDAKDPSESEGFVIRQAGEIQPRNFHRSLAKWVRPGHLQVKDNTFNYGDSYTPNGLLTTETWIRGLI